MARRGWLAGVAALALMGAPAAACGGGANGGQARRKEPAGHVRARPAPAVRPVARPRAVALPRRFGPPGHDRVPILMYHVIAAPRAGTAYPDLWTPPGRFAAQMAALKRAGYHAVTLQDAVDHWTKGLVLPARPVVVSFDDGYASQYRNAARTLRRMGWPGVIFLEINDMRVAGGLPPADVRRMLAAGWELGSHTVTHPDLTTLAPAALRDELTRSRAILRRTFGVAVRDFCYPAGRFDAAVEAATRTAGYQAATTTQPGIATTGTDRYALPRIRVSGTTSPQTLLAEVRGGGLQAAGAGAG